MIDLLWKEYELNEKYHDTKENRAWLACALYFSFSLILLDWLIGKDGKAIVVERPFLVLVLVVAVFSCSMCFVWLQFRRKWDSVQRTREIQKQILEHVSATDAPTWEGPIWHLDRNDTEGERHPWGRRHIEIPLLALMIGLFVFQLYVIASVDCVFHRQLSIACLDLAFGILVLPAIGFFLGTAFCWWKCKSSVREDATDQH